LNDPLDCFLSPAEKSGFEDGVGDGLGVWDCVVEVEEGEVDISGFVTGEPWCEVVSAD
jgi:hypothetical protein